MACTPQRADPLKLESWVKTTGGRGLHVVVPIQRHRQWNEYLTFSRRVAEVLVRADRSRLRPHLPKRGRESKILIDYLRNNRTNTSIAAFSTRARTGAPVSVPIKWDALTSKLRPSALTVVAVTRRLPRVDPWAGYWTCRQRLTTAAFTALDRL